MKLIRFLLSNLILIIFFCAIIYAYYYWDNLTGADTPAGQAVAYLSKEFKSVETFIDGIRVKQGNEKHSSSDVVAGAAVSMKETDTVASAEAVSSITEDAGVPVASKEVYVTPEIEQSLNQAITNPGKNQTAISTIVTQSNTTEDADRAVWIDARKAFYKRDYEATISGYKQVIANSTDNYDAYGELGNVYFNRGMKAEAAESYYEAALILVKLGQKRRAGSLLPLLNYLDSDKGAQLKELLTTG